MFRKTKRIVAIALSLALLLSLCSCGGGKSVIDTISNLGKKEHEPIDEIDFTVPYMRADSLDPYKLTDSMNRYVSGLIYDSLFDVDSSFKEKAVIADSFARIFFRNAVNLGLVPVICKGISKKVKEGQTLTLDFVKGVVTVQETGESYPCEALGEQAMKILAAGGIKPLMRARFAKEKAEQKAE